MKVIPECPTRLPTRIGEMIGELGRLWATSEVCPHIDTAAKTDWNAMLREWIDDCSIPLLVRKASLVRGSVSKHASGREIVPTDNSPAQWACHLALCGTVPTIQKIRDDFAKDAIPASFAHKAFEKNLRVYHCTLGKHSVNKAGWKLCHIAAVGLKTKASLDQMDIADLKKAFFRLLSPSNYFLLPKEWGGLGETAEFIAGFLDGIKTTPDYVRDIVLQELTKERAKTLTRSMVKTRDISSAMPKGCATGYYYSRLAFDAEVIERLESDAKFCVVTDEGTYVMTKGQFYETFANVVKTASYLRDRFYHYSTTPKKAKQYLLLAVDS